MPTQVVTVAISGNGRATTVIKLILAVGAVAVAVLMAYAVGYTDGWERSIKHGRSKMDQDYH